MQELLSEEALYRSCFYVVLVSTIVGSELACLTLSFFFDKWPQLACVVLHSSWTFIWTSIWWWDLGRLFIASVQLMTATSIPLGYGIISSIVSLPSHQKTNADFADHFVPRANNATRKSLKSKATRFP